VKGYKPTSFRFPPSIIKKIEELAEVKRVDLGIHKVITKSDMVTILVNEAYEKVFNKQI
jgi:hypothetical protein